jgi:hypothetical protein
MRNQFSLLAFFGKLPLELLEQYWTEVGLSETELGSCIPWETLKSLPLDRRSVAIIKHAIVNAPSPLRERVLQDCVDVDVLATDQGIAQLIAAGHFAPTKVNLIDHLALYDGSHAKALFVRCEWPAIFQRALEYHRIHGIAEHRWYKTGRIDGARLTINEAAQAHLRESISHHFCQQGRGRGCEVTVEERGEEVYVFVYPEDYVRRRLAFDDTHTLTVETVRPAFEVIFVFHRDTQIVECFASCPHSDRKIALQHFGRIMLDVTLFPELMRQPVYRLDALKYRAYPFPVRREDELLSVQVTMLKLAHRQDPDHGRMTVHSDCASESEALYTYLEERLRLHHATLDEMDVQEAHLRLFFRGKSPTAQPVSRTVVLALPDMLRLQRTDKYYPTIRDLLRRWQLDVAHTIAAPVFVHGAAH